MFMFIKKKTLLIALIKDGMSKTTFVMVHYLFISGGCNANRNSHNLESCTDGVACHIF